MGATDDGFTTLALTEGTDGVTVALRVVPRARRNAVDDVIEGALRVRVAAPPVDGAANRALVSFLSAALGLLKRDLAIIAGEQGRLKRLRVAGLTADQLRQRLRDHGASA